MEGLVMLVVFTAVFIGIALWAYTPKNKTRIEAYRDIPLMEEHHGNQRS